MFNQIGINKEMLPKYIYIYIYIYMYTNTIYIFHVYIKRINHDLEFHDIDSQVS